MVKPDGVNVDGTHVPLVAGTTYSLAALLQVLLMASGNDAAYALARGNQGVAVTLQKMNATAADPGAFDTVAKSPSASDKAGQQTSAYDPALIGRSAMHLPDFRGYVMTTQAPFPEGRSADGKQTPALSISNDNTLLLTYPGAIGIKNGYTNAAEFT